MRSQNPSPEKWWSDKPLGARRSWDYNQLIRVQGAHGRLDLALQTFHELAANDGRNGLVPDLRTLTAMFSACAVHGRGGVEIAKQIFAQMEADVAQATAQLVAVAPQSGQMVSIAESNPILEAQMLAAYSSYMRVLVEAGDPAGAEHVVRLAARHGLRPDIIMMTSLMQAHIKVGDNRAAWREWLLLPRRGLEPDIVSYTIIIGMCAQKGEVERCGFLLNKCSVLEDGFLCFTMMDFVLNMMDFTGCSRCGTNCGR